MNGQKYDYKLYEWEPEPEDTSRDDYFLAEATSAPAAPLAPPIIVAPAEGVLSRPVGELIASARESLHDSVLAKPVGELLRESVADTVLAKPVGELLRESVADTVLAKPVGEIFASARESLNRTRRAGGNGPLPSGTWA